MENPDADVFSVGVTVWQACLSLAKPQWPGLHFMVRVSSKRKVLPRGKETGTGDVYCIFGRRVTEPFPCFSGLSVFKTQHCLPRTFGGRTSLGQGGIAGQELSDFNTYSERSLQEFSRIYGHANARLGQILFCLFSFLISPGIVLFNWKPRWYQNLMFYRNLTVVCWFAVVKRSSITWYY